MDTLWGVLTWGLLWSWLKAASLYVMGNLGLNTLDAVNVTEQALWGESLLLLDSLVVRGDSDILWGLSMLICSSMSGVESAGQMPELNSMSIGLILGIGAGLLMADRCCSSCLTYGREASAEGCEDLGRCTGLGMQLGGYRECTF